MRKLLFAACLICLFLFAFGACGDDEPSTADKDKPASGPEYDLVIGVMPSMDYLPLAVARREGYFEQVGLKVGILKFYSANDRDAAFQSGNIDGAVIDYTGAILQKAGGVDLKLTSSCDAPFYIVSGKHSNIIDIQDLKGAKVGVSRNTVIDYCVDMALASVKLGPEDVQKVEINKIPIRYEMLLSGQIDATGLPNPLALKAAISGGKTVTSNIQLGFAITGMAFSQKAIDAKAESIAKLYRAYNLGVDYLTANNVTSVADILRDELGFSDEIVPLAVVSSFYPARMPREKDLTQVARWLADKKLIPADFDTASILDERFVDGRFVE